MSACVCLCLPVCISYLQYRLLFFSLGVPWVVGPNLIGNAGHVRPNKLSASPSTDLEEKGDFMLQIRCCPWPLASHPPLHPTLVPGGLAMVFVALPGVFFSSCLLLWDIVGGWRGCGQILKSQSEVTSSVAYGSWCLQPLPSPRLASPLHRWKMVGGCWGADLMPLRLECWLDSLKECLFHACD